jgi:hypothetical protein
MSIGTILMILALIAAILVRDIGLRPPPLYGPPEKNDKAEGEPCVPKTSSVLMGRGNRLSWRYDRADLICAGHPGFTVQVQEPA